MIKSLFVAIVVVFSSALNAQTDDGEPGSQVYQEAYSSVNNSGMIPTENAIAIFESRINKRPTDYHSWINLGRLYLRDGKERDHFEAYKKAESALRQALDLKPSHANAKIYLAMVLNVQHKFSEALRVADQVLHEKPDNAVVLSVLGDAQIELGMYDQARRTYDRLAEVANDPAVLARQAHIAQIDGKTQEAIELLTSALQSAVDSGIPNDQVCWYRWRLGDVCWSRGDIDTAEQHFVECLKLDGRYQAALSGLANVATARGQVERAIEKYEAAIAIAADIPTLVAAGNLLQVMGQGERADKYFEQARLAMQEEAAIDGGAHVRERVNFDVSQGRNLPSALERARGDYEKRKDIYASDLLAWTLFKNGLITEAVPYIDEALQRGTWDALIHYHAGMIYHGAGDLQKGERHLQTALTINPFFSITDAPLARKTLATMQIDSSNESD